MRCKGLRRDGAACGNTAKAGNKLCFWHARGEQAESKRMLARNLRTWNEKEMALILQGEARKFLRGKCSINHLEELRKTCMMIAELSGKKLSPLTKEKKSLTLPQKIKLADEKAKQKSLRRIK